MAVFCCGHQQNFNKNDFTLFMGGSGSEKLYLIRSHCAKSKGKSKIPTFHYYDFVLMKRKYKRYYWSL